MVVVKRRRVIEEKVEQVITADSTDDAIAACNFLIDTGKLTWRYNKTIETSATSVEVKSIEVKNGTSKR